MVPRAHMRDVKSSPKRKHSVTNAAPGYTQKPTADATLETTVGRWALTNAGPQTGFSLLFTDSETERPDDVGPKLLPRLR